jgi:hypothetical protein
MVAAAAAAVTDAPNVIAQPKVQWRMLTTWTPDRTATGWKSRARAA